MTLYKEDGTTLYRGSKSSDRKTHGGFLNHCSATANGTVYILYGPNKYSVFNLSTGARIKKYGIGTCKFWWCPKLERTFYGDTHSSYSYMYHAKIDGYKAKKIVKKVKALPTPPAVLENVKEVILTELKDKEEEKPKLLRLYDNLIGGPQSVEVN